MKYKGIYFSLISFLLKKPMIRKFGKNKAEERQEFYIGRCLRILKISDQTIRCQAIFIQRMSLWLFEEQVIFVWTILKK